MTEDIRETGRDAVRDTGRDTMDSAEHTEKKRANRDEEYSYSYQPPQLGEVPDAIKQKFLEDGFVLRWIRIKAGKDDDAMNVYMRQREGYVFVKPEEVPELDTFESFKSAKLGDLIIHGDLALAKIQTYKALARQKYFEDHARAKEKTHIKEAHGTDNEFGHVFDESRTKTQNVEHFDPKKFKGR